MKSQLLRWMDPDRELRGAVEMLRNFCSYSWMRLRRWVTGVDRRLLAKYQADRPAVCRLQLGCGKNPRNDWLNSDLFPGAPDVMLVDVRLPLVFEGESFDRIFTEHMIEHLSWEQGAKMLKECFRIAKPGGVVRVATPDIHFLINLVAQPGDDLHQAYMKWSVDRHVPWAPGLDAVVVMNNFVRDWGHRFVYDEATLGEQLKRAGFTGVVRCRLNESAHEDLCGLENESRMPASFLKLETLVMEGTKPSA